MNVYDFDNTIYKGESIVDFFMFCIKKDLKLIKYLPNIVYKLIKYKFNKLDISEIEKTANIIIDDVIDKYDYDVLIKDFWKKNKHKLKTEFLKMLKKDDLIITGCPNFLINYIKKDLNVNNIICTQFDIKTKKLDYICFGKNKVVLFNKNFKTEKINKFYTDSLADIPLMRIAKEVYLVKKNKIVKIDKKNYL